MRLTLGQLAPAPADPARNLERIDAVVRAAPSDLAVFPELFLSGYRVGDRVHALALSADGNDATSDALRGIARERGTPVVVGAPVGSPDRRGEVHNAVVLALPSGTFGYQVKRYLPNFGPFEEALVFSPTDTSRPLDAAGHPVGFEICYDAFFPEVARDLALAGATLLVNISASPVTSRSLFERLLPARAIENGLPVVYVNRVGVEDGFVFGGGTGAWDPRGEPLPLESVSVPGLAPEESVVRVEVDPGAVGRWRPFRPVLRDLAARPAPPTPR
ncbi:MAG TPA: carbon-nitrogen hydrolase family protein [Thermoplasmata archaeon]|nr:carbon-nitrogen hydrolase family protein [Thermoplasmata archaeon]